MKIARAQEEIRDASNLSKPILIAESATAKLDMLIAERRFDFASEPPQIRPIYQLSGQVICTPANLTALTAAVKAGKTAVIGAMMGAAMTTLHDADMLGFTSNNPNQLALLHFDSEQSPDDHWLCNMRVLKRAGLVTPPAWFHSYCLTGLDFGTAWNVVAQSIKHAANRFIVKLHGNHCSTPLRKRKIPGVVTGICNVYLRSIDPC